MRRVSFCALVALVLSTLPARADALHACKTLAPDELALFQTMVRSDHRIGESMDRLTQLFALTGEDKILEKKPITAGLYVAPDKGIEWGLIENVAKMGLSDCAMIRAGEDPSVRLTRAGHPRGYHYARQLCGPVDARLSSSERRHPTEERAWAVLDSDDDVPLRREITRLRGLVDPQTNEPLSPMALAEACTKAPEARNVEDAVEDLFVCLNAFQENLFEYDYATGKYVRTYDGAPKPKQPSTKLIQCVEGYMQKQVELSEGGKPVRAKSKVKVLDFTPPVAPSGLSGASGTRPATDASGEPPPPFPYSAPSGLRNVYNPSGMSGASGQTNQKKSDGARNGTADGKSKDGRPPEPCLPGDPDHGGACADDKCVAQLAWEGQNGYLKLPSKLTSEQVLRDYQLEKGPVTLELSREQARLLAQAYVVAAYQRRWPDPKAYNDNVKELPSQCIAPEIRSEIEKQLKPEYFDENLTDGAYDVRFGEQRDMAESKGRMMVDAIGRITALRQLVALLNWDSGAQEISTVKVPHWVGYLPVGKYSGAGLLRIPYLKDFELPVPGLHYMVDAPIAISFGNIGEYQCNLFSTMAADDWVSRDKKLVTDADRYVRKLFEDETFRKAAFCGAGGKCTYPGEFQSYLEETDPSKLPEKTDFKIKLRDWCQMRYDAGQSLVGLEQQLITLYPALAHADKGKDDKPGPPLFDRLRALDSTPTAAIDLADREAERVLPGMQEDLKKYVGRICSDYQAGSSESAFMAVLNRQFLSQVDYCASPDVTRVSSSGLDCGTRVNFLACEFQREAEDWREIKELPHFVYEVGMAGMDALFVYSAASGGIASMFTPKGIIAGGLGGVAFTGANYGITYLLARYNDQTWDDFHRGTAAAVMEGVDSYTNAITALASSQPKARLQDFVTGFMMGAVFSGKEEEGAGAKGSRASEYARKVAELADADAAGGVRFLPPRLAELKAWLSDQAKTDPELPARLLKNLGKKLDELSEPAYQALFEGEKGRQAGTQLRQALATRLRRVAADLGRDLEKARAEIVLKQLHEEKLTLDEEYLVAPGLQAADVAAAAETLGPRELALLGDAAEEASGASPREAPARLASFLRRLQELSVWCPGEACLNAMRDAFGKTSTASGRFAEAVSSLLNRKGRAQSAEVERILEQNKGRDLKEWENDILDRMSDRNKKTYPKLEELMALMAAHSPTFRAGLGEFLAGHGAMRFRVAAFFTEGVRTLGKDPWERGGKVTEGRRFWELWQKRIRLPARRVWTHEDLGYFMAEISNVMFRTTYPEPGFWRTWIKSFGDVRLKPETWKIWDNFAKRFLDNYRLHYREFMSGVTDDSFKSIRPEVMKDFYRWGVQDAIFRRLSRVLKSKKGDMSDPEYEAESERLALELTFFVKPVIQGYFLYVTMVEPAYDAYEANEKRKAFEKDVREHPDKYMPDTQAADDDRVKNFDEQIDYLTLQKRDLETELGQSKLSNAERGERERALDKINRRIGKLQDLKAEVLRGVGGQVHP